MQNYFIDTFGKPVEIMIDYFKENEYSESFIYSNGILVDFSYYDNILDNYKIFSAKYFYLGKINLYSLPIKNIFKILYNLHTDIKTEYSYDKDCLNKSYYFYNIGLTLWEENNYLTDVCVESLK